jgi:DnaJ-domain-containing protein 1
MGLLRGAAGLFRGAWRALLRVLGLGGRTAPVRRPDAPPQGWLGKLRWGLQHVRLWPGSRRARPIPPPRPYEPVQRLHPVPAVAMRLQKQAAGAFLEALGIEYLPGVLVDHLGQYDVAFALWTFCQDFGLSFHALATPAEPDHREARQRLKEIVGILVDVDQAARDTPLSGQPVVDALRRSAAEAEALLTRLHRAAIVWRDLHARSVGWPRFGQFRDVAARRLADWTALDEATLAKIATKAAEFTALRTRFAAAEAEIRALGPDLLRADDPDVQGFAERLLDRVGVLIDELRDGRLDPPEGVGEIEDILADLRELADVAAPAAPDPTVLLRKAYDVLELPFRTDLAVVKKRYRALAMRYHPDHDSSREATARMTEINLAYELILRVGPG